MPTLESIGASIEGLTAGSYEPRDLAIYVLVWLSVEVPGEARIYRARPYQHPHRRRPQPGAEARAAYGPTVEIDPGTEGRGAPTAGTRRDACRTRPQLPHGQEYGFKTQRC
jgi:hypothetical protein